MSNNSERPVDALAEKGESLTHSLTDNLKLRDASASNKDGYQSFRHSCKTAFGGKYPTYQGKGRILTEEKKLESVCSRLGLYLHG